MMDQIVGIILTAVYVYFVGHSFINSYFKHKAEMIDRLVGNKRGEV